MGWIVSTWDGIPTVWHNGSDGLNHSMVILMPDRDSGVVLLSNADGFEQLLQVDEIAKGVARLLNGKPASPVSLPWHLRFLYWTILLIPLLQIVGIAYSWRYLRKHPRNKGVGHILLMVVLYVGVALFWLFGVPQVIGSPIWTGIRTNFPELAYGLIAGAILGIGWSVVYTVMSLMTRRSK